MKSKIDIVYTWVDGNDPVWKEKKIKAQNKFNETCNKENIEPYALVSGRYRDNQELKYSLRSLEMYFPEHGQVFIVTDNQVPQWIDEKKVKIVNHTEIMSENLPTFSSKRIESNLYKIQGLSEKWLYFNDDVFLSKKFHPDLFFDHEKVGVYFLEEERKEDVGEAVAAHNAKRILKGSWASRQVAHAPRAIHKRSYEKFLNEFRELNEKCQSEIFRDRQWPAMLADLYGKWAIENGHGFEGKGPLGYIETHKLKRDFDMKGWASGCLAFCVNDTCDDNDEDEALAWLTQQLEKTFPSKSKFEK